MPGRRVGPAAALLACVVALLSVAASAQAAELVYWDNYRAEPASISFANIDGSGGGPLSLTGVELGGPEGMAFDSVTGRMFTAATPSTKTSPDRAIVYANVDGSGAGVLNTTGAEAGEAYGVAVDPVRRLIFWANSKGGPEGKGTIDYARLDGSGGGVLNTTGAVVNRPYRVAIDPVSGKVFWANTSKAPYTLAYANMDNSGGGGALPLPVVPESIYGLAVDSAAGRVYWLDSSTGKERLLYANENGTPGGEIPLAGATMLAGYGLAIDSSIGRLFWANYGQGASTPIALGFVNLAGGGGGITPTIAPVNGAQDPVILKSPVAVKAPKLNRPKKSRAKLECSTGEWGADDAGAFFYRAPRTYAYAWRKDGKPLAGKTAPSLTVKQPAKYACTVTATNQAGSLAQTSGKVEVKAAKLKLTTKTKAATKPGGTATFAVKAVNLGDVRSGNARVCVKLASAAKQALKAPKCKTVGKLAGGKKKTAKLTVKVLPSAAPGVYALSFQLKGASGRAAKAKLVVSG